MMEIKPPSDVKKKRDEMVLKMLLEAITMLGGPRKIAEYRTLTWIPSLIKANYAILLSDAGKTADEIAEELGLTKATVYKMLRSDEKDVMRKLSGELIEEEKFDEHIAGGLAKLAYKRIKERETEEEMARVTETAEILGAEWAVKLMTKIRGVDFPIDKDVLMDRLRGLIIFNIPIEEILEELDYPIASPSKLLREISIRLKKRG
ncbi:KaiC associated regulatory domain-containing protein [Candidatus Geothermarchaeota archaeon]|nr:MAG: KaiC associated regulatory domain-containing protein [Candidatus Geothermarchaeota archaeon]